MVEPVFNWLNGLCAFLVVIGAITFAILNLRRYFKNRARSPLYMAVLSLAIATGWTGISLSFLSFLFFGYTLPELASIISYFSYSTIPVGSFAVIIISWDLLFSPKYKKLGLSIFLGLYVIYYVFLVMTWNQTVVPYNVAGLIFDDWLSVTSVPFWMIWIIVGLNSVLWVIGFNNFRKSSSGGIQKRSIYLLLATFFIGGAILLDTVVFTGAFMDFVWISRVMMVPAVYLGYIGLSPI